MGGLLLGANFKIVSGRGSFYYVTHNTFLHSGVNACFYLTFNWHEMHLEHLHHVEYTVQASDCFSGNCVKYAEIAVIWCNLGPVTLYIIYKQTIYHFVKLTC